MPTPFGTPTPQEVMQNMLAQQDAAVQSARTPQDRRNAMMFSLGRMLTANQDPEMVRAKGVENALQSSMALTREESESALDYELRKGKDLYTRLRDVDPNAAFQIAERIITLEEERSQQARLKVQDERAAAEEARAAELHPFEVDQARSDMAKRDIDGIRYAGRLDPVTRKMSLVPGRWTHTSDPKSQLEIRAWADEGVTPLTAAQVYELDLMDQAGDANQDITGQTFDNYLGSIAAYTENAVLARNITNGFADAIEASINPTASVQSVFNTAQSIGNSIEEIRRTVNTDNNGVLDPNYVPTPQPGTPDFKADEEYVAKAVKALNERGMYTAIPNSLLTLYVYSLAKAQDARVTNMDFEVLKNTLSATMGNPEQVVATMAAQLGTRREVMTRTVERQMQRLLDSVDPDARFQGQMLKDYLEEADSVDVGFGEASRRLISVGRPKPNVRTPSGEIPANSIVLEGEDR